LISEANAGLAQR